MHKPLPEHWSGYGTHSSLSHPHLLRIRTLVRDTRGEDAVTSFDTLIERLNLLSPSNFLTALNRLDAPHRNWKWDEVVLKDLDADCCGSGAAAAFGHLGTLSTPRQNDSENIRKEYFAAINLKD